MGKSSNTRDKSITVTKTDPCEAILNIPESLLLEKKLFPPKDRCQEPFKKND